ncbi:DUF6531 domain-containing protein, partial [Gilliamella intestini]
MNLCIYSFLVWQRLYRTSAVEFNNGLGYGWSHTLCHSLTFTEDH